MDISKHLKAASDRYKLIAPITSISEKDTNVIALLIDIFEKIYYFELSSILKNWKKIPDDEIIQLLQLWLQEGSIPNKTLIKLGDKEINIQYLQSISSIDSYDNKKMCPIFKIIINQDETEKLLFSNIEIVFYSDKERKKELDDFKEKTKYLKIRFI